MSGFNLEPDWYGIVCMLGVIYMTVNKLSGITFISKGIDMFMLAASVLGLLLCLTRSAWVGAF